MSEELWTIIKVMFLLLAILGGFALLIIKTNEWDNKKRISQTRRFAVRSIDGYLRFTFQQRKFEENEQFSFEKYCIEREGKKEGFVKSWFVYGDFMYETRGFTMMVFKGDIIDDVTDIYPIE